MGVKDLWKLLEPTGRPVKLESLEGLVLGVDVSIWLNQAVKGLRDRGGEPVPNAHLIVLFNRICKLLYYHIRPVFVFDGATPQLKQQTLASRSRRRDTAVQRSVRAADRQASKRLQAKILERLMGEKSSQSANVSAASASRQPDLFQLPPIPEGALSKEKSPTFDGPFASTQVTNSKYYDDVSSVNVHSDEFNCLPPEVQHEILLERQQIEKYSYHDPDTLPQVANDFSNYQLSRLMKRSRISQKLTDVRKVLKSNDTAVLDLSSESKVHEVETSRIMSSEASHYILVKGIDIENHSSQDEEDVERQSSSLEMSTVRGEDIKAKDDSSDGYREAEGVMVVEEALAESDREDGKLTKSDLEHDKLAAESGSEDGSKISKSDAAILEQESPNEEDKAGLARGEEDAEMVASEGEERSEQGVKGDVIEIQEEDGEREAVIAGVADEIDVDPSALLKLQQVLLNSSANKHAHAEEPAPLKSASKVESGSTTTTTSTTSLYQQPQSEKKDSSALPSVVRDASSAEDHDKTNDSYTISSLSSTADEGKRTSSSSIDLTVTHTTQGEPALTVVPPPAFTGPLDDITGATENMTEDIPITPPPQAQVTAEVSVIELDEGSTPSPVEKCSAEEDIEGLLSLAPSEAQEQLGRELEQLERERTQQNRAAASVSNQMYKEAQELMSLFGLPYIVAPTEAEAQCAALDVQALTQGTITDDNDVFLFGGRKVYRHFFSQHREVEVYASSELEQRLGLSRDQLIVLAYLLGSDYTDGLEGIGIVMAMEFLRDFPGSGLEPLDKLREWHGQVAHKSIIVKKGSALQKKLCQYPLPAGFPNAAVRQSYLQPEVDDSSEEFEWGKPDLDLLRRFAFEKIGWSQDKVDELLLPVVKRMNARDSQTQKKITQFMPAITTTASPSSSSSGQRRVIKSKRIRNVVARLTAEDDIDKATSSSPKKRTAKRTKRASASQASSKRKQPAAKKRKTSAGGSKSRLTTQRSPSVEAGEEISPKKCNLSASSSSSEEDEFDSLVKDWKEEDALNDVHVGKAAVSGTRGRKTAKHKHI